MRQDVPEIPRNPPDGLPSPAVVSPVAFEKYRVCPAGLRSRTRRPVRAGSLRERHSLGSTPRRMSPPLSRQQLPGEWSSHTGGKYPCLCPSADLGPATRTLRRIRGPRTVRYRHSRADNAQRDAGYGHVLAGSTSAKTRRGSPDSRRSETSSRCRESCRPWIGHNCRCLGGCIVLGCRSRSRQHLCVS